MPVVEDAMRSTAEKTGTIDDVRLAGFQRAEQPGIVLGVVFEVGILDDDVVASRLLNSAAERSSLAQIAGLKEEANLRPALFEVEQNLAGTVAGAIIDAKEFDLQADRQNALDHLGQRRFFVVDGHHHREFHSENLLLYQRPEAVRVGGERAGQ